MRNPYPERSPFFLTVLRCARSLVGDFGFDPLGLGKKPEDLAWYVQAELVHARFAMLGAAGIIIPEVR